MSRRGLACPLACNCCKKSISKDADRSCYHIISIWRSIGRSIGHSRPAALLESHWRSWPRRSWPRLNHSGERSFARLLPPRPPAARPAAPPAPAPHTPPLFESLPSSKTTVLDPPGARVRIHRQVRCRARVSRRRLGRPPPAAPCKVSRSPSRPPSFFAPRGRGAHKFRPEHSSAARAYLCDIQAAILLLSFAGALSVASATSPARRSG